ncbi:MAG TPA: RluA family pseudouridine synthase [Candidatus Binatia bacterium]|jgi:23S rRNA pseudouridine1911/1915/1917 synthase|nr:RluA family pseudouridine synthase [Candidatus Binatia bacterium]
MEPSFGVIYEDAGLLVINKPAGLVCHPTKTDEYSSLISRTRLYLGQDSHPQLINRLDRETSGVALLAKDTDTARQLRQLWENRRVEKEYLAIVHGQVADTYGVIEAPLGKDERSRVAIKDCVRLDGAPARTEYWVEQGFVRETLTPGSFTVLRVLPHTGRKHQIRIHLASIGHPVVGDKLYGADEDIYLALVENRLTPEHQRQLILPYHALHARQVRLTWRSRETAFRAEPEPWFTGFLTPGELPAHKED